MPRIVLNMKTTKVLECAMARALFASANICKGLALKDCLMLQILSAEGTCAHSLISEWLSEEELHDIINRLADAEERPMRCDEEAEQFFRNYPLQLSTRFGVDERITTTHAMIDILSDRTTISSRIFPQYGVTIALLTTWMMHFSSGVEAV